MSDLNALRAKWNFLRALHPLFLHAGSLPTVEGVDQGHYGYVSVDDVDNLKNEITMLRNDFKLNIIKQQQVDIDELAEEDSTLRGLELDLQILLEELETFVNPTIYKIEEHIVSCGRKHYLSGFPLAFVMYFISPKRRDR